MTFLPYNSKSCDSEFWPTMDETKLSKSMVDRELAFVKEDSHMMFSCLYAYAMCHRDNFYKRGLLLYV